jgi:cation:H+ antiporter
MSWLLNFIETGPVLLAWLVLAATFVVLAKCADMFVESSVAIAERFHVPKIVIGIVLVALATTAPELAVSVTSAVTGKPAMAFGNAVGSVICNSGLALALCALVARRPIRVPPRILRVTGTVLAGVAILALAFTVFDCTLGRIEGGILVLAFVGYIFYLIDQRRRGKLRATVDLEELEDDVGLPLPKLLLFFAAALTGIVLSSRFVIASATRIAVSFGVPETAIALTLVAFGTSVPEVATSITAARKGEGELAVGNILGANTMNICWVAGASAVIRPLPLTPREIAFMFPAMFLIGGIALLTLHSRGVLDRKEGLLLFLLYAVYLASFVSVFG